MTKPDRAAPQLLSQDEARVLLVEAEQLWEDLQRNELGGFSGINRPFYIVWQFKRIIEKFGNRDVGLTWSKDELDSLPIADCRSVAVPRQRKRGRVHPTEPRQHGPAILD